MVRLGVDTRKTKKDLERGTKDAEESGKKAGSKWTRGLTGAIKGGLAAGGVAAAFTLIQGQLMDSVNAYTEAEQSQQQLADAFERFPKLADTNIERLRELNSTIMSKTKFDDDALASGQAVLAQYGISGGRLEALTPLLADYAAKTGRQIPDAAKTLGKAFLGNARALKDLGINYKSTGDKAKDVQNIQALLAQSVGGFAEQQGKTAAGRMEILKNKFGEIQETIGGKLLPVIEKLAPWVEKITGFIADNIDVLGPLAIALGVATVAIWAVNAAMAANPITWIILLIVALVAVFVVLWNKCDWFRNFWIGLWNIIKAAALAVGRWFRDVLWGQWIRGAWDAIVGAGKAVVNWFKGLPGQIKSIFMKVAEFITWPFRTAMNTVADIWNSTIGGFSWTAPAILGGFTISVPRMAKFHKGGIIPGTGEQPIMAMGGEGVFTREQMAAMGQGGVGRGGGVSVLELRSGGSKLDDFLIEMFLRAIRKDRLLKLQIRKALGLA
jgi:hypothetical protein